VTALPAGLLLLDTGIYIRYSRREAYDWLLEDTRIFRRTILTAVVAAELYAGTRERGEKTALDQLCRAHQALLRFSTPSAFVWSEAGILLRRARSILGEMDFSRHFRDALIALEAVHSGATLLTENTKDFTRWQTLLAKSGQTFKFIRPSLS